MKKIFAVLLILLVSSITFYLGRMYESKSNVEVIEANNFKRECLDNYDMMSNILEGYIDRHIKDSACNALVDSLSNLDYYKYYYKVDSLYNTQL